MSYTSTINVGLADRIRGFFAELGERSRRAQTYRTTFNELNALSGRELADLGIHRSEIKRVAYEAAYTA